MYSMFSGFPLQVDRLRERRATIINLRMDFKMSGVADPYEFTKNPIKILESNSTLRGYSFAADEEVD